MRRNQVRNQVSDYVEYEFDRLHRRIADRMVYPLAAVEGAVQGVARGVHNLVTHKHPTDRATCNHCRCNCSSKPHGFAFVQAVGPYECYGYPPPPPPPSAASLPPPPPPAPPQFQYHPAFPVPCRPPY
ncbi:hypothetical protein PTKIN_Ptkin10aG0009400 [Pterospermum kingtungense]